MIVMVNRATMITFSCLKILFHVLRYEKRVYGNDREILLWDWKSVLGSSNLHYSFKMKWKAFFIIFKEISLKQIKTTFLRGESLLFLLFRPIFANVICCSRLWLWLDYFIYFKFTRVLFYLMLLMDVLKFE